MQNNTLSLYDDVKSQKSNSKLIVAWKVQPKKERS